MEAFLPKTAAERTEKKIISMKKDLINILTVAGLTSLR